MSDIYLSLTETPTVVTLSQPVISGALSSTVTVANTVTVALDANSLSALENVTVTVGAAISGTVTVANFPASQTVQGTVTVASLPAISGSVTVNNFPSTQTIAGTVTANLSSTNLSAVTIGVRGSVLVFGQSFDQGTGTLIDESPLPLIDSGEIAGDGVRVAVALVDQLGNALGTDISTPIVAMVSNPVTIGSLPAISGTVTANLSNLASHASSITKADKQIQIIGGYSGGSPTNATAYPLGVESTGYINSNLRWGGTGVLVDTGASALPVQGTVTARLQDGSGNNLTSTSIGGVQRLNVSLASAATPGGTLPTFVNVYGGSDSGTVRAVAVDSSGRSVVTVSNFPSTQTIAGTVTANLFVEAVGGAPNEPTKLQCDSNGFLITSLYRSGSDAVNYDPVAGNVSVNVKNVSSVTVSALPSGALTTRFGSVTTANTAQITSAVTNTSRKYLLAQNISAGTVTIGIGFSPTTTQGIQLTAGGGLTFDAFCPTGAVYWLGAVTGAAWTILEA